MVVEVGVDEDSRRAPGRRRAELHVDHEAAWQHRQDHIRRHAIKRHGLAGLPFRNDQSGIAVASMTTAVDAEAGDWGRRPDE